MPDFNHQLNRQATNSIKWDVQPGELPLSIADMDFATAPAIVKALQAKVATGVYGYEYVPDEYYQAVDHWYQTIHGVAVPAEWQLFTPGVMAGLGVVIRHFTNPGDQILLQTPVYNHFFVTIAENARRVVESELTYDPATASYAINWADLEAKLADPATTMMIICNPQNPSGIIWSTTSLERIADLAAKHHVLLFVDEIHGDLILGEKDYHPFFGLTSPASARAIVAVSPSKTFNVAAVHAATLIIRDATLKEQVARFLVADGHSGVDLAAVPVTVAGYTEGEGWLNDLKAYLRGNWQLVLDFCAEQLGGKVTPINQGATYLAWLDVRQITPQASELAAVLREVTGLILNDGTEYGAGGEAFLRLNFAYPRAVVQDGLDRLKKGIAAFEER